MVMQSLDSGNASKVLKGFLTLLLFGALAGLVLTDVGGFFRDGTTGFNNVAHVGNETISAPEFARVYQRRLEQSGINPEIAAKMNLPNMILQQEVERLILLQAAHQNGARINDMFIANQLQKQLDSIQMAGTPQEKLQQVLMQQQLSEKQLVELLRGDFSINVLASAVTTGDMVVPSELAVAAYRNDMQKRNAQIIRIPASIVKSKALDDKAVENYFNEHKENYRTGESRDVEVLVLPQSMFIKNISVSPAQVEEFYENNKDQFLSPESVRLSQIITDSKDAAQRIYKEAPKDLAGYQGDATQYLAADWYNKDGLPNEISELVYQDKKTGLYAPVETSLGWHVIMVEEFKKPTPRAFSEVKTTIERQLKDEQLDEHLTGLTNEIDTLASEDVPLKEIAAKYKLKLRTITGINSDNVGEKLKAAQIAEGVLPRIQEAVFTLESNETSPLMDTASGDYALARIVKLKPSAIPALDSVRAQVEKDANTAALSKNLQDYAEALVGKFDAKKPEAFDKAVKEAGLTVDTIKSVTKGNVEDDFSAEIANLLFTMTPDNALSYTQRPDAITLVRLTGIEQSKAEPSTTEKTALQDNLRNTLLQEIQQQFTAAWQEKLGLSVNQRLLQNMFTNAE